MLGEAVSDAVSGLFASWGVLAALLAREKTGRGTHVDVSMFDATLSLSATLVARYAATGLAPRRVGNRHPSSAPFGVYRAADGFYVVAVLNNKLFQALANAIGRPEMAQDPRFADDETRCRFEGDLRAGLEAWSASLSVAEVNRLLSEAGIPVAPIRNVKEALESEHAAHRGLLAEVPEPEGGTVRLPSQPVKFSGYGANRVTPARRWGSTPKPSWPSWPTLLRRIRKYSARRNNMHKRLGVEPGDLEIADAIGRFAQSELAPKAAEVDRAEASTTCYVPQLAELG